MTDVVEVVDSMSLAAPGPGRRPRGARVGQVSVIVHTRNDADRIADLVTRVEDLPGAAAREIVFVDDSDDDTTAVIRRVAEQVVIPVHLVHRPRGRRSGGLGSALRAGLAVARCEHVCLVDCSAQATEAVPALVQAAAATGADLVTAGGGRFLLVRRGAVELDALRGKASRVVRELVRRNPELRVAEVALTPERPAHRTAKLPRPAPWRAAAPRPVG